MAEDQARIIRDGLKSIQELRGGSLSQEQESEINRTLNAIREEFGASAGVPDDSVYANCGEVASRLAGGGGSIRNSRFGYPAKDEDLPIWGEVRRPDSDGYLRVYPNPVPAHNAVEASGGEDDYSRMEKSGGPGNLSVGEGASSVPPSSPEPSASYADQAGPSHPWGERSSRRADITSACHPDDLEGLAIGEKGNRPLKPKRLNLPKVLPSDENESPEIKKGIEKSTNSSGITPGSWSKPGAIPCVPLLSHPEGTMSVPAENVRLNVTNVQDLEDQGHPDMASTPKPNHLDNDPYDDDDFSASLHNVSLAAESRIDLSQLLENQQIIMQKLDAILSFKSEIESIKKQLTKQNLALSTLEGHMSSIMIAVPGSGKPSGDTELNPDLKPILGRDRNRGFTEVTERKQYNFDDSGSISSKSVSSLRRKVMLTPLDHTSTNASEFIPKDDLSSRYTIKAIIRARVKDPAVQEQMLHALDETQGDNNIKTFHNLLLQYLDQNSEQ